MKFLRRSLKLKRLQLRSRGTDSISLGLGHLEQSPNLCLDLDANQLFGLRRCVSPFLLFFLTTRAKRFLLGIIHFFVKRPKRLEICPLQGESWDKKLDSSTLKQTV